MPAGQIDHAPAAKQPARAPRHFPPFEQLFSRQATGVTDRARKAIEQRAPGKAIEIAIRKASA